MGQIVFEPHAMEQNLFCQKTDYLRKSFYFNKESLHCSSADHIQNFC